MGTYLCTLLIILNLVNSFVFVVDELRGRSDALLQLLLFFFLLKSEAKIYDYAIFLRHFELE